MWLTRLAVTAVVVLVTASCSDSSGKPAATGGSPTASVASASSNISALSAQGQLLRDFEAFLKDRFDGRAVYVEAHPHQANVIVFTHHFESLADESPYFFTFRHPESSRHFLLTTRRPPDLGNYPVAIKINDFYVKCSAHRYLARNAAAYSFSLYCLSAL